jgi:undecaprenyl-diphosphatase
MQSIQKTTQIERQDPFLLQLIIWFGFSVVIIFVGKWLDQTIFQYITPFRSAWLDTTMVSLTEYILWGVIGAMGLVMLYRVWKDEEHTSKLVPVIFAAATAGIFAFILKSMFDIPRPYLSFGIQPLVFALGSSFPSGHAAVSFAMVWPLFRISRIVGVLWIFFSLAIGGGRIYEFLHYPSDILFGMMLGGVIGAFFASKEVHQELRTAWSSSLEFRRQSFHFLAGFFCVFFHWIGFLRWRFILVALLGGLCLSLLTQYKKLPMMGKVLQMFDRPRDKNFPGRGAFYYLLAVFLCIILFPRNADIAYSAILILAVGDSLNHLLAQATSWRFLLPHLKVPWNKKKSVLGVLLGIAAGTFAAQFFIPAWIAFVATTLALLAETIHFRIYKYYIDDNLFVPLIAGGVIWFLL